MIIKNYIKKMPLVIRLYNNKKRSLKIAKEIKEISNCLKNREPIEQTVDTILSFSHYKSSQKRTEIIKLLQMIEEKQPKIICEIGTQNGGTLLLLSRIAKLDSTLISIDVKYPFRNFSKKIKSIIYPTQNVYCIEKDSRDIKTQRMVENIIKNEKIDFLFIDGDHSYEGVSKDFSIYSKYIRNGGIIAFHDINPDNCLKNGRKSGSYVGEVPKFWGEITKFDKHEFIENSDQDGYGIGVIEFITQ